jgi:hypothetical protein
MLPGAYCTKDREALKAGLNDLKIAEWSIAERSNFYLISLGALRGVSPAEGVAEKP